MRVALIPMAGLAAAKTRLASALDADARAGLSLAMLTDVLAACTKSGCFDRIAVVSDDDAVLEHAHDAGASALPEPATLSDGLNGGLEFARGRLARDGANEIVIFPADIPLARAADVRSVVDAFDAAPQQRVVLVRSRDNGTNALAMRPARAIPMRFGPNSADAHRAAAAAAGITVVEVRNERIARDVDGPDDLAGLGRRTVGAATRAWLAARPHRVGRP
jgi:2-phospho-L-lactate guanylyltransferase